MILNMILPNNFYKLTILSLLAFTIFTVTKISFAQEAMNVTTTNSTPVTESITTSQAKNSTITSDSSFNPAWLLPLAIIPILLYLLWPKNRHNPMDLSQDYAGVKGGKAQTKIEEDDDDDLF